MSNLKEIRGRIASVNGTMKITSAMRLIASAKLHSAQNAIGNMVPYEKSLQSIVDGLLAGLGTENSVVSRFAGNDSQRTAVVLVASNQTLCGSFNANVLKAFAARKFDPELTDLYVIGRHACKQIRKTEFSFTEYNSMAGKAVYDASAALADKLIGDFLDGRIGKVVLIYTHFISTASQKVVVEQYLPFASLSASSEAVSDTEYILEPEPEQMLQMILPKVLRTKFHTVMLDAAAAEHAARSLAMQIATDNGNELLGELSLMYNKLRQQAITNELLDLVGGQVAQ